MPETEIHKNLVLKIIDWLSANLLSGDIGSVFADLPSYNANQKPSPIESYIPDVCVRNANGYNLVIGEAKLSSDIENKHTYDQIKAYLKVCSSKEKAMLIFAVPWDMVRSVKSLSKYLQKQTNTQNVEIKVLEKLSGI